jgi:hypothetical protein
MIQDRSYVFGVGHSEGPEPRSVRAPTLIEAGAPSTEEATLAHRVGARPTGDSHGRTTRGPTQRGEGAKQRPRPEDQRARPRAF